MSDTYRNSRAGGRRFRQSSSADRIMAVQNARSLGTGSRRGGSGRRRGRRQGPDMAKIVLIVIGVLILLICAAVGFQSCARSEDDKTSVESESETETTEPETEMAAEIICERSPGPWPDKNRGDQEGPGRYGLGDEGLLRR